MDRFSIPKTVTLNDQDMLLALKITSQATDVGWFIEEVYTKEVVLSPLKLPFFELPDATYLKDYGLNQMTLTFKKS
jgi:hypothetical protein